MNEPRIITQYQFSYDPEAAINEVVDTGIPTIISRYGKFIARIEPVTDVPKRELQDARRFTQWRIKLRMKRKLQERGKLYSLSALLSPYDSDHSCFIDSRPTTE